MPKNIEIQSIPKGMTKNQLLSQKGWFYLNEAFRTLDPDDTGKYKLAFKKIERVIERGDDPFEIMGRQKIGGRVAILMEKFAPWYGANPIFQTRKLDGSISFQAFLKHSNCFFRLSEVCKYYQNFLPYSYAILKRDADRRADPLKEIGIVKSDTTYLVALPRFEEWLRDQLLN